MLQLQRQHIPVNTCSFQNHHNQISHVQQCMASFSSDLQLRVPIITPPSQIMDGISPPISTMKPTLMDEKVCIICITEFAGKSVSILTFGEHAITILCSPIDPRIQVFDLWEIKKIMIQRGHRGCQLFHTQIYEYTSHSLIVSSSVLIRLGLCIPFGRCVRDSRTSVPVEPTNSFRHSRIFR